jgi:UDP:flavonoid glycosyltransferase YjiC (YdhE family)
VETAPVPLPLIARRSRLALHAGNHGIALFCAAAGLPQVMIPQQLEQEFNARRIAEAGLGVNVTRKLRTVPRIRSLVATAYSDASTRERCPAAAHQFRTALLPDPRPALRARILSAIGQS